MGLSPRAKDRGKKRREPTLQELEQWMGMGVCEATDGCLVEPDGVCHHGKESWLLAKGFI